MSKIISIIKGRVCITVIFPPGTFSEINFIIFSMYILLIKDITKDSFAYFLTALK